MNSLELTTISRIFLGIYLIVHGLIHLSMIGYDEKNDEYTGWSGESWVFDKFVDKNILLIFGKSIWVAITLLFVISGIGVFGLSIFNNQLDILIILSSVLAIVGYIVFFNGIYPTPYHWLLGVLIDVVLIVYVVIYPEETSLFMVLFGFIALIGFIIVFMTEIVPTMMKDKQLSVNK